MKLLPLALISLLFFIFSIPGTNALRYLLAVILLVFSIYNCYSIGFDKVRIILSNKYSRGFFLGLLILTVYILVHSIFISHEMYWSLKEFKGHWLTPVLFLFLGILLAIISQRKTLFTPSSLITAIFLGMFAHILYLDIVALKALYTFDNLISRYGGLTGSPVLANYLTNILIALTFAELISRHRINVRTLQFSNFFLIIILFILLFSQVVEGMRHGAISLFFLGIAVIYFYYYQNKRLPKKTKIFTSIAIFLLLIGPLIYSFKFDSRWATLIQTIPIALDTETNKFWQDRSQKIPKLPDGRQVSLSNYERMAWIYKGLEYITKNPIGLGFGRNAFGHSIQLNEGLDSARGMHSHSSIIDLTLGIGVLGLILWLVILWYLLTLFLKSFIKSPNFYSISGFMLISGFFFRSLVDSNMRDHIFQQFFLLLGVIIVLLLYEKLTRKNESS